MSGNGNSGRQVNVLVAAFVLCFLLLGAYIAVLFAATGWF